MITKIIMDKVACYKNETTLSTDKKINLIYGLNGTGKSTLSDYLYDRTNPGYEGCSIEGLDDEEIMVYNQHFIRDNFYESDTFNGIFTLSKKNAEATEKIRIANKEIDDLKIPLKSEHDLLDTINTEFDGRKQQAIERVWVIKIKYSGGDRVLEYCLDGLKGKKESLFDYVVSLKLENEKPKDTIEQIKKEASELGDSSPQPCELLPKIKFNFNSIEQNELFSKQIVGNENSSVSGLIKKLDNSDWVKEGLEFVDKKDNQETVLCPFCQQRTITKRLLESIESYFDEAFENDIKALKQLILDYDNHMNLIPNWQIYASCKFVADNKANFEIAYNAIINCLKNNISKMAEKIASPSKKIELIDSKELLRNFNMIVDNCNGLIADFNRKIRYRDDTLKDIKKRFWTIMRWEYDQTISSYLSDKNTVHDRVQDITTKIGGIEGKISEQKKIIAEQQKKTENIDDAIEKINSGLLELGIDGFHIEKDNEVLYKLVRDDKCQKVFLSLSEGEKMIISFLYFRELCNGKIAASMTAHKKIIVIDDPISSLSHIYIFNVGQIIEKEFLSSDQYEQIFLLTHSLYFFYEMTFRNSKTRAEKQNLFRLYKNEEGSKIFSMRYDEIQNDYQSYWIVIKDESQRPALIANCMRNIIEYFFGFIEKRNLNEIFKKPSLSATKYQAFYRYINRESHSDSINVFDLKEFNYEEFKEAFRLVFLESGYEEHYNTMIK